MEKSNYYKARKLGEIMEMRGKKGQLAIFVIIAIVIVAVVLIVLLYPKIKEVISPGEFSGKSFLKSCIDSDLKRVVGNLSNHGGYMNPEGSILYNGVQIKYLCYTNEYYKTCVVQEPMIKQRFLSELDNAMKAKASECVAKLREAYRNQGYDVSGNSADFSAELAPGKMTLKFDTPMTITKTGTASDTFDGFEVSISSKMYELLLTAQTIVEFEARLGGSETTTFIQYYPDLKIEKTKLSDGSTIYKLTNVITEESFTFASRSLVWPSGFLGI